MTFSRIFREKWLLAVLLSQVPLLFLTGTAFAPVSYGWFNAWADASDGLIIYKDFFVPFPIVAVWLHGTLPNLFQYRMLAESIIAALVWMCLVAGQFLLSARLFEKKFAAVGTVFAAYFYFAFPINKVAGYYETMLLFLVFGTYFLIRASQEQRGRAVLHVIAGICLSIAPFVKQTAVIPSLAIFLFGLYHIKRDELSKCINLLVGYIAPVVVIFLIAMNGGYLWDMIECLSSGGGKSPSFMRGLTWGFSGALLSAGMWPWIATLLWMFKANSWHINRRVNQKMFGNLTIGLFLIVTVGIIAPQSLVTGTYPNQTDSITIAWVVLFALLAFYLHNNQFISSRTENSSAFTVIAYGLLFLITLPFLGFVVSDQIQNEVWIAANGRATQLGLGGFIFTLLLFVDVFVFKTKESDAPEQLKLQLNSALNDHFAQKFITLFLLFLALGNSMAAGFTAEAWEISVGLLVAGLCSYAFKVFHTRVIVAVSIAFVLPFLALFSIRIIAEPYNWIALRNEPLQTKRYSIPNSAKLWGFSVNQIEKERWVRMQRSVANSDLVFAGPNIGGLPSLLDKTQVFNNCPIIWWDVCPENLAMEDFRWLKMERPELVMWNFQPEYSIQGSEGAFRGGEVSAIRLIQEWLTLQISIGKYDLVDKIPNYYGAADDNNLVILKSSETE
jgi:hypothetical protein